VAERYQIGRAEQDAFAVESQGRAARALKDCVFTDELVPVPLPDGTTFAKDEYPRAGTTLEAVAQLKPAFRKGGTVTAASSSGLGDPLGATGARVLTTLVHALRRTKTRYGLATMCIGVGQGIAMIVERV